MGGAWGADSTGGEEGTGGSPWKRLPIATPMTTATTTIADATIHFRRPGLGAEGAVDSLAASRWRLRRPERGPCIEAAFHSAKAWGSSLCQCTPPATQTTARRS